MLYVLGRRRKLLVLLSASALLIAAVAVGSAARGRARAVQQSARARLSITKASWGSVGRTRGSLFTLTDGNGMMVKITNYGGVVQSIWVPDRAGKLINVVLGFSKLSDYVKDFTQGATQTPWPLSGGSGDTYFGSIVGRYANRIANHAFSLNGKTYVLDANNGTNTLHGGYLGWNTVVWSASTSSSSSAVSLKLSHDFPAGEGCLPSLSPGCAGFPAPVTATVTYSLTNDNQLKIGYHAKNQSTTDATVINLTNHTYFNLGGEGSGSVENQLLAINADKYTPVNTNLIPKAPDFLSVAGTPFDFRKMTPVGENLRRTHLPDRTSGPFKQLQITHGYDNNFVLRGSGYRLVSVAQDANNGVTLWTYTDQPGVQLYSSNFLIGDLIGTGGTAYRQTDGFTLETQHYPNSPHHIGARAWPSVVLKPGATFTSTTSYKFTDEASSLRNRIHFA